LADNAPEVMFSMVTNTVVPTGLTWRRTWGARARQFPLSRSRVEPRVGMDGWIGLT
jgi:hypothetical protein